MSEGLLIIEVDGKQVELYFGMKSVLLFSEKFLNESERVGSSEKVDLFKTFSYIIFSGLVNNADRKDLSYPNFEYAYDLTEKINEDDVLTKRIFDFWDNCKASKKLKEAFEKLNPKQKAEKKKIAKV